MKTIKETVNKLLEAGLGRMGGDAEGPGGDCVCPECGHKEKHSVGKPCTKKQCAKCKTFMIREQ